jgi:hypothetical protein
LCFACSAFGSAGFFSVSILLSINRTAPNCCTG